MNIDITPATREDAEALAQIQKQAFKRLYEIYQDKASPYLRGPEEILAWLDRPNWHIFKIHANGVLCGGLSFFERNGLVNEYYLARVLFCLLINLKASPRKRYFEPKKRCHKRFLGPLITPLSKWPIDAAMRKQAIAIQVNAGFRMAVP